jgi:hypothetical protein
MKLPVSERALMLRINRVIAPKILKKNHSLHPLPNVGNFYIVNANSVTDKSVNLVELATQLGVLKPYEILNL